MKVNSEAVRAFRVLQGRTLRDVADQAGIDNGNLHRIETGLKTAGDDTIRGLAAALGVPVGAISYPDPVAPGTIRRAVQVLSELAGAQ
jgi:transcriptional regulator with XRE-family HTH domain